MTSSGLFSAIRRCRASSGSASLASMVLSARTSSTPASASVANRECLAKSIFATPGSTDTAIWVRSRAIGTPSSSRTRSRWKRSVPGTMDSSSASSKLAGTASARSTSDCVARPIRSAVSVKDSSVLGHSRFAGLFATYHPRPCEAFSTPASISWLSALRSVTRLMPSCWQSSRSGGSRAPARSTPSSIWSRIRFAAWIHSGSG
jgi:hypothetical protein